MVENMFTSVGHPSNAKVQTKGFQQSFTLQE